jgi:hypothetical protein
MKTTPPAQAFVRPFVALLLIVGLAACGGGGSGTFGGSVGPFTLESISVADGSTWELNRPIELRFSADVDFATVNSNTIQVEELGGAPAAGEFRVGTASDGSLDPTLIVFAPRCPTLPDFSDGGFRPGAIAYHVNVVGGGGITVQSANGRTLEEGLDVGFVTPDSLDPAVLFVDTLAGPPAPVIRTSSATLEACYLEIGGDPDVGERVYFQPRVTIDAELGADVPAGFQAPLNLYSSVEQQLAALVVLDQAIEPSPANLAPANVRLEYREGASWLPLAHTLELEANCTETGARLRVRPTGILPRGRLVRLVLGAGLRDLVGDGLLVDLVVGSFEIADPNAGADEWLEEFATGAGADLETDETDPAAPHAQWGGGVLAPGFDFPGTGGPPDGQFDYEVGSGIPGSQPVHLILDTTFTLLTDVTQTRTEAVVDGFVDVRDFTIHEGSSLTVIGPNALTIAASGAVRIRGTLRLRGENSHGVATLNTTCTSEPGAGGNAGGGKGGTGNYLTTQSTPKGEDGYGAFDQPALGGGGGHTAYRSSSDEVRRPGGGGGGRLGADVMEVLRPLCPDQTTVGLDAEAGFPGTPNANDAILGAGVKPVGGTKGPGPFGDADPNNDFFGLMEMNATGAVVRGELAEPTAGAGGGAGGNSCNTATFPTTPFSCTGDEKGCGGGAGGGSLKILALGEIVVGPLGKIDASGGAGGGGENSLSGGITRIGGGSGGGSGGHVVLQSASQVDLSSCVQANGAGIFARGGQGGAGKNDAGGAHAPGTGPYLPNLDALPPNSYPSSAASTAACKVWSGSFGYTFSNTVGNGGNNDGDPLNVVTGCGGDGGPGIIQIHVQRLSNTPADSDLKIPANSTLNPLRAIAVPTPMGATPTDVQTPGSWNRMLPQFGRFSTGLSKWIPLGAANVVPGSSDPQAVQFLFRGTDSGGYVPGPGGSVTQLPALLSGVLASAPALPYVTADRRTIVFDPSGLDPLYTLNPALMRRFGVRLTHGASTGEFEVLAASLSAGELRLTVATTGAPLQAYAPGDAVSVVPRFFRVRTDGVDDALPASAAIRVRFQAAPADAAGDPTLTGASTFQSDAAAIQNDPNAANFKFVRFRVDFDILADGSPLSFATPRPTVEFLRLPFQF